MTTKRSPFPPYASGLPQFGPGDIHGQSVLTVSVSVEQIFRWTQERSGACLWKTPATTEFSPVKLDRLLPLPETEV